MIYLSPTYGFITLSLADPDPHNTKLFSHFLWNAGLQLAEFIEEDEAWGVRGQRVLELGAGTGLAGLVAALSGAREVVISDYPAPEVLSNIRSNISTNISPRRLAPSNKSSIGEVHVEGHKWGTLTDSFSVQNKESFDTLLVADCLWMPPQHENLLRSIRWFLKEDGRAWVVAGFHTGRAKMRGFYAEEALKEADLEIEKIWERNAEGGERRWVEDRGIEDVTERKRWLVVGILRRRI